MPEEIRPTREIVRPFIDNRTGASPLQSLSRALGAATKLGEQGLSIAVEREQQEIADLLSSPDITAEEAAEIENNAKFPINAIKAQNRRGELLGERALPELQERLNEAPDAVEARRLYRQLGQELEASIEGSSAGVRAGLRERLAREAGPLLAAASRRRIEAQDAAERQDVGEYLRLGLEENGADGFVNNLLVTLSDEAIAQGDEDQILSDATLVVENLWQSGADPDKDYNINTPNALDAIDSVLDNVPGLNPAQRNKFFDLRKRIASDGEALRRASAKDGGETPTIIFRNAILEAENWLANPANKNVALPQIYRDNIRSAAPTGPQTDFADKWIEENAEPLVLDDPLWKSGEAMLRAQFAAAAGDLTRGDVLSADSLADALAVYNSIGFHLPPDLLDDEKALLALREQAIADAPKQAIRRKEARAEIQAKKAEILSAATAAIQGHLRAGNTAQAELLRRGSRDQVRDLATETMNDEVYSWIESQGYDPFQYVDPL